MMQKIPTARDMMKTSVVTVHPESSILAAAQLLVRHSLSGVPVVDQEHRIQGVVSERDCLLPLVESGFESDPIPLVRDRMSKVVKSVPSKTDVGELAEAFAREPIRRLLVVDEGKLLGIVTRKDLLKAIVQWIDPDEVGRPAPRNFWSRVREAKESPLAE
jgi:CBS domain-containing protein